MFAAPYGRFHIWGLTAGILRSLAEALRAEEPLRSGDGASRGGGTRS